jgi:RHS repeat-associated protein
MMMSDISTSSTDNRFRYNGKEYQNDLGLEWYDYGARMYDPALARWHSVDPMAEDLAGVTPYNYCFNNPISYNDPTGMLGEHSTYITSSFTDPTGKVIEHKDDGDPRVYYVENEEAWRKRGSKKDGLPVIGFEDPKKDYKPGDQYVNYSPTADPNYKGDYLIPADAYDYSQEVIDGKFTQDWAYIIYGSDGVAVSRWAKIMWRDLSAPTNRETVIEAGLYVIPGGAIAKIGKGFKYVGKIGSI